LTPVRIGIDARELCGRPTGVGRYLSRLLSAWDGMPEASAVDLLLYTPQAFDPGRAPLSASRLRAEVRVLPGGSGTWWEQATLASAVRRDRPDVLFAPAYTAPLAIRTRTVLTVHDVSFLAHPEWFPAPMRIRQRVITTAAARRARHVVTDSEFSRGEIAGRIGIPSDRIRVIPLGLTPPAAAAPSDAGRPRAPLVLFVGSIFNRRHLPEAIEAVAAVARHHPEVRLEIVGDNRTFPHQDLEAVARGAGAADRTAIRSYVSDDVLADLYARAGAFVFLSDYEGFGLTPLEALSFGVPIIVGDTPVAREVYGEAARYVGTSDAAGAAAAIEALLFDDGARRAVLSRAPGILARYSWARAGRETLDVLLETAGADS
jgi:glycosyltransferase involved in cell wall biosynthesis